MNIVYTLPQNRNFYLYLLKFTNLTNGRVYYKLGKADNYLKRKKEWEKELMKILSFYDKMIVANGWRVELIWHKAGWCIIGNHKYYMTSNPKLSGNDSDDIFRGILENYFGVKTYKIHIYDTFLTDEGVDFGALNEANIKLTLNGAYSKWLDIISEKDIDVCDSFVRIDLKKEKKLSEVQEFTTIQYEYQKDASNWIYEKLISSTGFDGKGEDFLAIIPCGAGKTSISMSACTRISKENDYKPILLLAGLKSVFGAFITDSKKYTYNGVTVKCYSIESFTKDVEKENKEQGIVSLVYTTCQAGRKRGDEEEMDMEFDTKLSERLFNILDEGVEFSSIITDEAHKVVFGDKMVELYPAIRNYHKNPLNIIHMSGTGFNTTKKMNFDKKIYTVKDEEVRKCQGEAAVNRHMIVCRNTGFIPFFEEHIESGWDYILEGKINVNTFNDVDTINCISTIKSGIEKPVIGAYLSCIDIVKKSFDYLTSKYSYDDALIISANGCSKLGKCDCFVRNDINGNIKKISTRNAYIEVVSEVSKFANNGKMVILLNVDKFVESWTIKEMNVQLLLRNVGSPDTFGQSIARGLRIYMELNNVIKKDAYVFLYGDTFTKMTYELFFTKYNYRKYIGKHGKDDAWENAMKDVFIKGNTIYMDGIVYGYEENNLNDLRSIILRDAIRCDRSADSLIRTMERTFYDAFSKLYNMNVSIYHTTKSGGTTKINVVDGEGNSHSGNSGKGSGSSTPNRFRNMSQEELYTNIKTFMYSLYVVRVSKHAFETLESGSFDYDTLVLEADENPFDGQNNYYLEFDKEFCQYFGDEVEHFKDVIMNWIEGMYSPSI